jgi:hypothetical protein
VEWLKETLRGLSIASENASMKLFKAGSPLLLTHSGSRVLKESGLEEYIDGHRTELTRLAKINRLCLDPYQLQDRSFRFFAEVHFAPGFDRQLNEFAFSQGMSIQYLRRVGAIYFRDLVLGSP